MTRPLFGTRRSWVLLLFLFLIYFFNLEKERQFKVHKILFKKKDFIYLFMRGAERGRDPGRERSRLHAGSPMGDSIPGLWDHALG